MLDEGYIKYNCQFVENEAIYSYDLTEIIKFRTEIFDLGLIGIQNDGISFGNVSQRIDKDTFIITASGTGKERVAENEDFSFVKSWNIHKNTLRCEGFKKASSESLSHAAIYETLQEINVVLHIHSKELWKRYLGKYLTTRKSAEYGTALIALDIKDLATRNQRNVIILGGHRDGILVYAETFLELSKSVNRLLNKNELQ